MHGAIMVKKHVIVIYSLFYIIYAFLGATLIVSGDEAQQIINYNNGYHQTIKNYIMKCHKSLNKTNACVPNYKLYKIKFLINSLFVSFFHGVEKSQGSL